MQPATREQLIGAMPVFLLEVVWQGFTYRFSSFPLQLLTDDGSSLVFDGGLEDPELEERIQSVTSNPETEGLSVAVVFPVDMMEMMMVHGQALDLARGELSMVLERSGEIQQTYEQRIRLFSGLVIQPIIGDPEMPAGYSSFTLERNPLLFPSPIIASNQYITPGGFPDAHVSSYGKPFPLIIGQAYDALVLNQHGNTQFQAFYSSPGYIINRIDGGSPYTSDPIVDFFDVLIAGDEVQASHVTILDYQGNQCANKTVVIASDLRGNKYSRIRFRHSEYDPAVPGYVLDDGIVNPYMTGTVTGPNAQTDKPEYWIKWVGGGGLLNPFGTGFLELGGDICVYMLSKTGVDVDFQAWVNIQEYLNNWRFAGYINDPELSPFEFLMDNILPFMPVEVVNGADGLRPVVPLIIAIQYLHTRATITEGQGFYFSGALITETEPDDIINRLELQFAMAGDTQEYISRYIINGDLGPNQHTPLDTSLAVAVLSFSQFGDRFEVAEAPYIVDYKTAARAAEYIVRSRALIWRSVEIQADPEYGWLQIGDVVAIVSSTYHLTGQLFQLTAKTWSEGGWILEMRMEDNISAQERSTS